MLKYKQWFFAEHADNAFRYLRSQDVPTLVAAVLCSRGLDTPEEAKAFLSWHPKLLCDPLLMQDMSLAVERIRLALERGERIVVYGDYDVDGITSTCLLTHYLRSQNGQVSYYIPCRLDEGYGLNQPALDTIAKEGAQLLITVDCGITAVEEVEYAKRLGMEVIITDHHECKEHLPEAVAVINPHRPDCAYPFKDLAGVGVALKLVMALAGAEQTRAILDEYSELAAVGTIADVMKLLEENRSLVCLGLERLKETRRPGLRALLEESGTAPQNLSSTTVGFCLAPRLNAAGRMGHASLAVDLILTEDPQTAEQLSHELCAMNRERQNVELEIFQECVQQLGENTRHDSIVLAASHWHQGVVGIVASRLAERYACPVFMISLQDGKGKGSCRSYGGFNLFQALEASNDLLDGFGGHALAAGFTIDETQIDAFRQRIHTLVQQQTGGEELISTLTVDVPLKTLAPLTVEEVTALSVLEPYGNGNPKPVFSLMGMTITCLSEVGGGRHLKLRLCRDNRTLDAIFFSVTRLQSGLSLGDCIDLSFYLQINEFRGLRSVQLHVVDIRPSQHAEPQALLYARFCQGHTLSPEEVKTLVPERDNFRSLWRYLVSLGGFMEDSLPSITQHANRFSKAPLNCTQTKICLDVLEESGLIHLDYRDGRLRVRSRARPGIKMDLEQTSLMRRLRNMQQS